MTDDTLMHRQVNPSWIQDGRPSSQTFRPTRKDEHKLSLYNGELIDAEASWFHFTARGFASEGVLSLTVQEFAVEELTCHPSPEIFEQHAHADYRGLTESQMKAKSKRLLSVALSRGWQYRI